MKRLFLFCVFLLSAIPAFATTRYVNKAGSDSNSCALSTSTTDTNAKLTISGVAGGISCMASGDTLYIGDGTYAERINNTVPAGSSSAPSRVLAENRALVILRPVGGSFGVVVSNNYVFLDGLDVDMVSSTGAPFVFTNGGSGVTGLTIQYSIARNGQGDVSSSSGIIGECVASCLISHNTSHDNDTGTNQDHGIYVSGTGNTIEYNNLYDNGAYGLQVYPDCTSCIVRGNVIHDNILRGVILYTTGVQFYNNVVYGNNWAVDAGGNANLIYNNTIYNNGSGTYCIWLEYGTGSKAQNNICYLNTQNTIQDDGTGSTVNSNLFTNPNFTNAGAGDFTLTSSSTGAIDTGVDLSATLASDIIGVTRPQGAAFDRGAYEFSSGATVPPPSTIIADASCTGTGSGTSISFSCTVADHTNREAILFVAIGTVTGTTITSANYNGDSFGVYQCGSDVIGGGTEQLFRAYTLLAPDTGTHTVTVNLSDTPNAAAAAMVSFYNTDQTTAYRGSNSTSGAGSGSSLTIDSASGDLMVDGVYAWNGTTLTPGSGQTALYTSLQVGTDPDYLRSSDKLATGSSTNMAWTFSTNSDRFGACGFSLIPNPTSQPNFKNVFLSPVVR